MREGKTFLLFDQRKGFPAEAKNKERGKKGLELNARGLKICLAKEGFVFTVIT